DLARPGSGREGKGDAMALIVNIITITGPAEAVFDLVTTARYWPRWHPATLAVGGVTQRPFGLGDRIHERVRFGEVVTQGTWEVGGGGAGGGGGGGRPRPPPPVRAADRPTIRPDRLHVPPGRGGHGIAAGVGVRGGPGRGVARSRRVRPADAGAVRGGARAAE